MPGWKFWEKPEPLREAVPVEPEVIGRFGIRPRTDLVGGELPADRAVAARVSALRRRRDAVLFDVEQATLAGEAENPWLVRVATIDEAIAAVDADLARSMIRRPAAPGVELPPRPVEIVSATAEPAPRVVIRCEDQEFVFVEELDWAERGHQIARTQLHLESGAVERLIPDGVIGHGRDELREVLVDSLFTIATAAIDQPLWPVRPLRDLASPDLDFGGWLDVNGSSPRRRAHAIGVAELTAELERLRVDRDRELGEMARWRERLPVALRRLKDDDAEIAAALVGEVGGGR